MRFNTLGTNWEGRLWRVSESLDALIVEVEALYPKKNRADGTVASKTHDENNPTSDHRPYPYDGPGVVNAVDVGENIEGQGIQLAEMVRATRDPRLKYLIHESRLFSSYPHDGIPAWTWRPYTGPNPHLDHVHISVLRTNQTDGSPWQLGFDDMQPPSWAVEATQWHIDRNIYTEDNVSDVDEPLEFHRQTVFRKRMYDSIKSEFGPPGPPGPKGDKGAKGDRGPSPSGATFTY